MRIFLVDTWASLSGEACGVGATVLGNEIFLVDTWATSLSGEAGGVGATVLGNEWAMSGVQRLHCSEARGARIGVRGSAQERLGTLHPVAALITSVGLVRPTHGCSTRALAEAGHARIATTMCSTMPMWKDST